MSNPPPPAYPSGGHVYPSLYPGGPGAPPPPPGAGHHGASASFGAGAGAGPGPGAGIAHGASHSAAPGPTFGAGPGSAGYFSDEDEVDVDREMPLASTLSSRVKYNNLADMYALIKTLEHLETAYVKSSVKTEEYTGACMQLIGQIRTQETALKSERLIVDVPTFLKEHGMACPHAAERLRTGVPTTAVYQTSDSRPMAAVVAETVQYFITAMDGLKLDLRAADDIQPLVSDLMTSLNRCAFLPPEFEGKKKLENWLVTFRSMRAIDKIDEDQHRQLAFDLDQAYSAFHQHLAAHK